MSRIGRFTLRATFGLAVAGALGLGATQALQATEPGATTARACDASDCFRKCRSQGAFGECYNGVCYCS